MRYIVFVFLSTFNILRQITTFHFENVIILAKKNIWAVNAWAVTILFAILTSSVFFMLSLFLTPLLLHSEKLGKIADFLLLLPLGLLLAGIFDSFVFWQNRFRRYKKIVGTKIVLSSSTGLSQCLTGGANLLNSGLMLGFVIGYFMATVSAMLLTVRDIVKYLRFISFKKMLFVIRQYSKVPVFNSLINLIFSLSNELPIYFLSTFYGLGTSGFYGMANKITAAPLNMIVNSVSQVFFQRCSEDYNKTQDASHLIKDTYRNMLRLSIFPLTGLLLATFFIHYLLGEQWTGIGWYIFILIPSLFVNFIIHPVSSIYTITNKQDLMLIFTVVMVVLKFLALFAGYYFFENILISLTFFSLVTTLYRTMLLFWFVRISKNPNNITEVTTR